MIDRPYRSGAQQRCMLKRQPTKVQEKVLEMKDVLRYVAVQTGEELHQEEEYIDRHGVSDDTPQLLDRLFAWIELGVLPDDETQNNEQTRAGGEGRGQEARRQDGGHPEGPRFQT